MSKQNDDLVAEAKAFIERHEGCSELAKKLGWKLPYGASRVNNWKRRGLPMWLKATRPELFEKATEA